jgi:chaperonin GroES
MPKLRILGDRVMVKPDDETTSPGGIVLPETAKERPQKGTVVGVGEGRRDESGKLIPVELAEGDRVVFAKYGGHKVTVDGEDFTILDLDQIYAKITA